MYTTKMFTENLLKSDGYLHLTCTDWNRYVRTIRREWKHRCLDNKKTTGKMMTSTKFTDVKILKHDTSPANITLRIINKPSCSSYMSKLFHFNPQSILRKSSTYFHLIYCNYQANIHLHSKWLLIFDISIYSKHEYTFAFHSVRLSDLGIFPPNSACQ